MTNTKRILIVEDNPMIAKVLKGSFQSYGIIDHAPTAKEALLQTQKEQYTLILMDIGLGEDSGIDVTRSIRATESKNKDTPIIAVSAHVSLEQEQECLDAKMNEVFIKPLSDQAFAHIVKQYLS